jgi:hypothetical protein
VLAFIVAAALIAIALMTIGGAMVREGRTRRLSSDLLADQDARPPVGGGDGETGNDASADDRVAA